MCACVCVFVRVRACACHGIRTGCARARARAPRQLVLSASESCASSAAAIMMSNKAGPAASGAGRRGGGGVAARPLGARKNLIRNPPVIRVVLSCVPGGRRRQLCRVERVLDSRRRIGATEHTDSELPEPLARRVTVGSEGGSGRAGRDRDSEQGDLFRGTGTACACW